MSTQTVPQEQLVSACEEALNYVASSLIPQIGDAFFAHEKRDGAFSFTAGGLPFAFRQLTISTASQYDFIGYGITFTGWQGKEKTRQLILWVSNPQANAAANRRAATACAQELLRKIRLNAVQATVDGSLFLDA